MIEEICPVTVSSFQQVLSRGRWRAEALHSDEDHLMLWFTKGQGRINVGGITRVYAANSVVFIPAGTSYSFEVKLGVFGTQVRIQDRTDIALQNTSFHIRLRDVEVQASLVSIIEGMQRELRLGYPGKAQACVHHAGLLGVWLMRQASAQQTQTQLDAAERLVTRYTELLEVRFAAGVNVAQMAQELGVTPTHLSRCCRKTCGRTAHELLSDRLLYEARDLLSGTTLPVKRIATDLGFRSAAYFTRSFQNHTGMTPSGFRKAS